MNNIPGGGPGSVPGPAMGMGMGSWSASANNSRSNTVSTNSANSSPGLGNLPNMPHPIPQASLANSFQQMPTQQVPMHPFLVGGGQGTQGMQGMQGGFSQLQAQQQQMQPLYSMQSPHAPGTFQMGQGQGQGQSQSPFAMYHHPQQQPHQQQQQNTFSPHNQPNPFSPHNNTNNNNSNQQQVGNVNFASTFDENKNDAVRRRAVKISELLNPNEDGASGPGPGPSPSPHSGVAAAGGDMGEQGLYKNARISMSESASLNRSAGNTVDFMPVNSGFIPAAAQAMHFQQLQQQQQQSLMPTQLIFAQQAPGGPNSPQEFHYQSAQLQQQQQQPPAPPQNILPGMGSLGAAGSPSYNGQRLPPSQYLMSGMSPTANVSSSTPPSHFSSHMQQYSRATMGHPESFGGHPSQPHGSVASPMYRNLVGKQQLQHQQQQQQQQQHQSPRGAQPLFNQPFPARPTPTNMAQAGQSLRTIRPQNISALWVGNPEGEIRLARSEDNSPFPVAYSPGYTSSASVSQVATPVLPSLQELRINDFADGSGPGSGSGHGPESPFRKPHGSMAYAAGVGRLGITKEIHMDSPRGARRAGSAGLPFADNIRTSISPSTMGVQHMQTKQPSIAHRASQAIQNVVRPDTPPDVSASSAAARQTALRDEQLILAASGKPRQRCKEGGGSKFCHVCRHLGRSSFIVCSNVSKGMCRKVVCERCFIKHGWDWQAANADLVNYICCHCKEQCPSKASCHTYKEVNKRRGKRNGRKVMPLQKSLSEDEVDMMRSSSNPLEWAASEKS